MRRGARAKGICHFVSLIYQVLHFVTFCLGLLLHGFERIVAAALGLVAVDQYHADVVLLAQLNVGYDNVLGYLDGAVQAWETAGKPLQRMPSITPEEFAANGAGDKKILDVRKPSEYEAGHLASATNLALDFFADQLDTLSMNEQYSVHCKSGYRSMIAASILAANGAKGVVDMIGGYDSISKLDVDKVIPVAV